MTRQSRPVRAIPMDAPRLSSSGTPAMRVINEQPRTVSAGSWWLDAAPARFTAAAAQHAPRMAASKEGQAAHGVLIADDLQGVRSRGPR